MMTEVMVHSLLDRSFSFAGSNFNHIQAPNETEMSTIENNGIEEGYNQHMNTTCDSSEGTICDSDTDDSIMSSAHVSEVNMSESMEHSSDNIEQRRNNMSGEDYKIVSTETTVINTTYNLIAQSTTRQITNMTTGVEHSPWSSFENVMTEAVDKSRVVVQLLKSDLESKSQNVIEAKSTSAENQSTHSFRDDLCKLLSKSGSSKSDDGKNRQDLPIKNPLNIFDDTFQNLSSESQDTNTVVRPRRRKRKLYFYFRNGRGMKIRDLKCVDVNINQACPTTLRDLHYVMFNKRGLCGTASQLLDTRRNIARFCGYPFKRSSEQFQMKLKCLKKTPIQMLNEFHQAIFGETLFHSNRSIMIEQLADFLWRPRKCSEILERYKRRKKHYKSEKEYAALKESALKGPILCVRLEKLSEDDVRRLTSDHVYCEQRATTNQPIDATTSQPIDATTNQPIDATTNQPIDATTNQTTDTTTNQPTDEDVEMGIKSSHTIPAFILNGPGAKLKSFPKITNNVQSVDEEAINMLHYILYGRIEPSIKDSRRNILEFNGFLDCQQEFVAERKAIIMGLNQRQLFKLCQILCLRGKTNSRQMRIKKILEYLQSPTKPKIRKSVWPMPISSRSGHLEGHLSSRSPYKNIYQRKTNPHVFKSSKSNLGVPNHTFPSISSHEVCSDDVFSDDGWRLWDFKTICSNVECAAPSDLIELNDLLFLKTCDECDIHQKILDFSRFKFSSSSVHYDARKTLMHYMGFCVVRKIAHLLNIENWDKISNPEDLSTNILKFLMEKKGPDSPYSKSTSLAKSAFERNCVEKLSSPTKSAFESNCVEKSSLPVKSAFESNCVEKSSSPVKSAFESNCVEKSSSPAQSAFEHSCVEKSSSPEKSAFESKCVEMPSSPEKSVLESNCIEKSSSPAKSAFENNCVEKSSSPVKSVFESSCVIKSSVLPSSKAVLESRCNVNPEIPKSFKSKFFQQQTNQAVTHHNRKVFIQRLTKASIQTESICQSNQFVDNQSGQMNMEGFKPDLPCINSAEDDSTRLRELIHHPTEQELTKLIHYLVKENFDYFTLGDLVQRVHEYYPKVNLTYRENFIKATARQMLSELRDYAVSAVKDQIF